MTSSYCGTCGTRLTATVLAGRQRMHCSACGYVAWRNPTPVGLAVIEHEGQLVMIRRREAPLANYWAPPAGYVECGESVPQAVIREAREECGLDIELDGLLDVYSQADVNVLIVAYRAHSTGGGLRAGDDASEARLFAPGELPDQSAPTGDGATDRWFFRVIEDVTTRWRQA